MLNILNAEVKVKLIYWINIQKIIYYVKIFPKVERLNLLLLNLLVSLQYNEIDIKVLQLSKNYLQETLMKTKSQQKPILCRASLPNLSGYEFKRNRQWCSTASTEQQVTLAGLSSS